MSQNIFTGIIFSAIYFVSFYLGWLLEKEI
jgi:hypothetical protein